MAAPMEKSTLYNIKRFGKTKGRFQIISHVKPDLPLSEVRIIPKQRINEANSSEEAINHAPRVDNHSNKPP